VTDSDKRSSLVLPALDEGRSNWQWQML